VFISWIVVVVWAWSTLSARSVDPAIPLALLGLATVLFTGPSGVQLIVRHRNGEA
jgi:hypothetical protein